MHLVGFHYKNTGRCVYNKWDVACPAHNTTDVIIWCRHSITNLFIMPFSPVSRIFSPSWQKLLLSNLPNHYQCNPHNQVAATHVTCGSNLITRLTSAASPRVDISSTCKVGQKLGMSLPLLTWSLSAWPSRLLYRGGRKSRRDLWIILYSVRMLCLCGTDC